MTDRGALAVDELIVDRARYASIRRGERSRMVAIRAARRVQLGGVIALEFESAPTLRYQAQEVVYVEGISDPQSAAVEVDAYSRLLPTRNSLCATFLLEIADATEVRAVLDRLSGVHAAVQLRVGDATAVGEEIPGPDEDGPSEHTASVHFLRFTLDEPMRDAFVAGAAPVSLVIDHPGYVASATLDEQQRQQLIADLTST